MRALPLVVGLLVGLVHPASAVVQMWRAEGTVDNVQGTASLLPFVAEAGDPMVIEFSYDDAAPDQLADPNLGRFAILSASVTIAGATLDFFGSDPAQNRIQTQLSSFADSWILSACRADCSADDEDEARLGFFLPVGSRGNDALLPRPQPGDADAIQFLLRSVNASAGQEAFIVGELGALIQVPEPATALSLAMGIAILGAIRSGRRSARR
jgi:hypothetical protein